MEGFDKICVSHQQIINYDLDFQEVGHNGAEEYIRKDALIEWADNWKKLGMSDDFLYAMETLVNHINSM